MHIKKQLISAKPLFIKMLLKVLFQFSILIEFLTKEALQQKMLRLFSCKHLGSKFIDYFNL